jgi:hypothetical protein
MSFVAGNASVFVPPGPAGSAQQLQVLPKRTAEARLFDIALVNLLNSGETITGTPTLSADQGALTFGAPVVNAAQAIYQSGLIAPIGTVVQVEISAGTIPSYLVGLYCTVRCVVTTSEGNTVEAAVLLNLTDSVLAGPSN